MRWVRVCSLVVAVAVGCGESVRHDEAAVECMSDLDCAGGQKCVERGLTSRDPGRDLATGGTCPFSSCGMGCPNGQVCASGALPSCPMYMVCQAPCSDPTALPCGPGTLCRSSGLCEVVRCDESEYPGCPTGMTCDPTVDPATTLRGGYSLFGTDQYPYTDYDHGPMLTSEQNAAAAARCVFLLCDEPGAFGCADGFLCDAGNASTSTGCVGIPCGELGRCASDAFICEPTSAGRRNELVDPHGCVEKNCEEGHPCPNGFRCDPSSPQGPLGDVYGCVGPSEPPDAGAGGTSGTAGTGGTSGGGGVPGVCR